jgi:hypothetical protein
MGVLFAGLVVVVTLTITSPHLFSTLTDNTNNLINAKEVEVYRRIDENQLLLPSIWSRVNYTSTESTPRLVMKRSDGTDITTMKPNSSTANTNPSYAVWRKTGSYVELYFVFDMSQGSNAALTNITNLKLIYTLPTAMYSTVDPTNEMLAANIIHSISSAASNGAIIVPKKILAYTFGRKTDSTDECNKICIEMFCDTNSIHNLVYTGSLFYRVKT